MPQLWVRGAALHLSRLFGSRTEVCGWWQENRSWESWQRCHLYTVGSEEDAWASETEPRNFGTRGAEMYESSYCTAASKGTFKICPLAYLGNFEPRIGTNPSYKTWQWIRLIPPPFSAYKGYFISVETEAYALLAPTHVAVCSCNREGGVMLLDVLVTTGFQIEDWFGCWKVQYKLVCLGGWKYHITKRNVYDNSNDIPGITCQAHGNGAGAELGRAAWMQCR